jgi:hypothetical protein
MTHVENLDRRPEMSGGYKVDVSRGQRVGRVSSEWFSRPDDERYLSLSELARAVGGRSQCSRTRMVETSLIQVEANRSEPERMSLLLPGVSAPVAPTHWSFGQLASLVGAPASYTAAEGIHRVVRAMFNWCAAPGQKKDSGVAKGQIADVKPPDRPRLTAKRVQEIEDNTALELLLRTAQRRSTVVAAAESHIELIRAEEVQDIHQRDHPASMLMHRSSHNRGQNQTPGGRNASPQQFLHSTEAEKVC